MSNNKIYLVLISCLVAMLTAFGCSQEGGRAPSVLSAEFLSQFDGYLVSYWTMDELSGDRSDSLADNDLADGNNVGSAGGMNNLAANFERGISNYLVLNPIDSHFNSDRFAISMWVKLESQPAGSCSGDCYYFFAAPGPSFYGFVDDNEVGFVVNTSGGGVGTITTKTLETDVWYHLVFIADGKELSLYVNGQLLGTPEPYEDIVNASNFYIGASLSVVGFFDGLIDEVGFWSAIQFASDTERDTFASTLYNNGTGLFLF